MNVKAIRYKSPDHYHTLYSSYSSKSRRPGNATVQGLAEYQFGQIERVKSCQEDTKIENSETLWLPLLHRRTSNSRRVVWRCRVEWMASQHTCLRYLRVFQCRIVLSESSVELK